MNIGEKVLMFRTLIGESQEELGKAIGVTQRMMAMYQKAIAQVPETLKSNLCRYLGINELWFQQNSGNIFSKPLTIIHTKVPVEQIVRSRVINSLKKTIIEGQFKDLMREYAVNAHEIEGTNYILFELTTDNSRQIDQYLLLSTPVKNSLLELIKTLKIPLLKLTQREYNEFLLRYKDTTILGDIRESDKQKAIATIRNLMQEHNISIIDLTDKQFKRKINTE